MSHKYRCGGTRGKDRHETTFKKPIDTYTKRCHCGAKLHVRHQHKQEVCQCDGLPFHHREGSRSEIQGQMCYCVHYKGNPEHEDMLRDLGAVNSTKPKPGDEPPF